MTGKVIHHHIFDPTRSLFECSSNEKAESYITTCFNLDCPLLSQGQCHMRHLLKGTCPYGKNQSSSGYSKRARRFHSWISQEKERYKGVPSLKAPEIKMQFIGDYVYLPYNYMNKIGFFEKECFLSKSKWTVDNVVAIVDFVPRDLLFGQAIKGYQESVSKFLTHLREKDEQMWQEVMERRPHLYKEVDNVGRKAFLRTLNHPIEWTQNNICWKWDGEKLTTSSLEAYSWLCAKVNFESIVLTGVPEEKHTIVVQSNDWVNDHTEFLD